MSLRPNSALSWQGMTIPARPASRTSDSLIPLQRQRYISRNSFFLETRCRCNYVGNDYDNRYQLIQIYPASLLVSRGQSREIDMTMVDQPAAVCSPSNGSRASVPAAGP